MFESQTLLKRFVKIEILNLFLAYLAQSVGTKTQVILDYVFVSFLFIEFWIKHIFK